MLLMDFIMDELKQILTELKQNYGVIGIRTDMASEIVSEQEFIIFKQFCNELNLKYIIKIGGCDALTDIHQAKKAGVDSVICPMIETEYALQKFVDNCKQTFEDLNQIDLLINIETIYAYNNLGSILANESIKSIKGIVLGRDDMAKSLNNDDVDSDKIFNIASDISNKACKHRKAFVIGGGIRPKSTEFLKCFNKEYITNYETRRIVFNSYTLNNTNFTEGIRKAIEFEIKWLEYLKTNHLSDKQTQSRIETLKKSLFLGKALI